MEVTRVQALYRNKSSYNHNTSGSRKGVYQLRSITSPTAAQVGQSSTPRLLSAWWPGHVRVNTHIQIPISTRCEPNGRDTHTRTCIQEQFQRSSTLRAWQPSQSQEGQEHVCVPRVHIMFVQQPHARNVSTKRFAKTTSLVCLDRPNGQLSYRIK